MVYVKRTDAAEIAPGWPGWGYAAFGAIIAIAHKLLIAAFHMLSTGKTFRDLGESYLDQVARKRSAAKLVQRLSNLGYDVMLAPKAA